MNLLQQFLKQLNYLYENSKEVKFDNGDNIVFMSDIHRGDGTFYDSFLPNKNIYKAALSYYYKKGFTYVEVGDGDELWKNINCTDIAYVYNDVFKVLNKYKEENRLYIINFKYTPINEKFLVTHGHQADEFNYRYWMISRFLVRYPWKFLNGIAGFRDPSSPAKNNKKGNKVDKRLEKWAKDNGKMVLCGHTHNSRMPECKEPPYFNDGCAVLPYAITAIEVESGRISLVKWNIEAQESGVLWVRRKIITGPRNIEEYLLWARQERIRMIEDEKIKKRKGD